MPVRSASILLALVVLGCCRVASAWAPEFRSEHDYTFTAVGQTYGFRDGQMIGDMDGEIYPDLLSYIHLGPLGEHEIPFTAPQGLSGFCVLVTGLVALVAVGTVRWRKRAA